MFRFLSNRESKKKAAEANSTVDLKYLGLEPRRVLNADFDFDGFSLEIDNFSNSDALDTTDNLVVTSSGTDYFFQLSEGVFSGTDSSGGSGASISGIGTGLLTISDVDNDLDDLIFNDSSLGDQFDIEFGDFDFTGDINIGSGSTSPLFGELTQQTGTSIFHSGSLNLSGIETISLNQTGNDFNVVSVLDANNLAIEDVNDLEVTSLDVSGVATINAGGSVTLSDVGLSDELNVQAGVGDLVIAGNGDLELSSIEALDGSVQVTTTGDVFVGSVVSTGSSLGDGDIDITAGGSINDLDDDLADDLTADGLVTLTAADEIGGIVPTGSTIDVDQRLEVAGGTEIDAFANSGNVVLRANGDVTLQDVEALSGSGLVDVVAAGDVLVGRVSAATTIDIISSSGGINDLGDDLADDLIAGGLVTLTAANEIGGIVPAGSTIDVDQRLEVAGGTEIDAFANLGNVVLRANGDVTCLLYTSPSPRD